jgi:hypothetical protein
MVFLINAVLLLHVLVLNSPKTLRIKVSPKLWYVCMTESIGITNQNNNTDIFTAVRTSTLTVFIG